MNTFLHILIFGVIALLYTHFTIQNATSDEINIYEVDNESNHRIQTICDSKQALVFLRDLDRIDDDFCIETDTTGSAMIDIRDAKSLFAQTKEPICSIQNFVSVNSSNHKLVAPPASIFAGYNILCGSKDAKTPTLTHNYYRKFIHVQDGEIELHISPFSNSAGYYIEPDYANYTFSAPIEMPEGQSCVVPSGYLISIPPNCFYTVRFICDYNYCVDYSYHSLVSLVSNLHHIGIFYMQQQKIQYIPDWVKPARTTSKALVPLDPPIENEVADASEEREKEEEEIIQLD